MTAIASSMNLARAILSTLFLALPVWVAAEQANTLTGQVLAVGSSFGNLETDIPIDKLSIELGESFSVSCNGRTVTAVSSGDYADVHSGEWLGIENGSGNLQLAISFGDASAGLGCNTGDTVTITF